MNTQEALIRALVESPECFVTRMALADLLEEQGVDASGLRAPGKLWYGYTTRLRWVGTDVDTQGKAEIAEVDEITLYKISKEVIRELACVKCKECPTDEGSSVGRVIYEGGGWLCDRCQGRD